jgi:hypothetical protein
MKQGKVTSTGSHFNIPWTTIVVRMAQAVELLAVRERRRKSFPPLRTAMFRGDGADRTNMTNMRLEQMGGCILPAW